MQSYELTGLYTYIDNIRTLKIGDQIKLKPNPNNRLNSEAIGAYTLNDNKIGYVPFKLGQIDITCKYIITKINLVQNNLILLISRDYDKSNFINVESLYIKKIKYKQNINSKCSSLQNCTELNADIKKFHNYLIRKGNNIQDLYVTYNDDNFINLLIKTTNEQFEFMTVTKKYYEENIFIYDEFYKYKLIPKCIFEPFLIHRLEIYLQNNYKDINKLLKIKNMKLNNLYFEDDLQIKTINVPIFKNIILDNLKNVNEFLKLLIQYNINLNENYNPNKYFKNKYLHSFETMNLNLFTELFNNIKVGGICYNHNLKSYCYVDLYDDTNIIDITIENNITEIKYIELLLKLVIANKQIINLYNPINGQLIRLEVPEFIKEKIINIINKKI
jgi:hypothetical protein